MKKTILLLAIVTMFLSACTRIDAGHVGIKVKLTGTGKGVQDITEVTGWVFYNPISYSVYEFPTFMQHVVWSEAKEEGSNPNEHFVITAKGGSNFKMDMGFNFAVDATRVPELFKTYRKDIDQITNSYLRNTVRQVYNDLAATYSPDSLITNRALYEQAGEKILKDRLHKQGFIVSQCVVMKFTAPESLQIAINNKNTAVQDALTANNKVKTAEANAKINVANVQGNADALRIQADADAYANKVRQQSLTPLLVQQQFIERWDGKLPVYGEVPTIFKDISK